MEVLENLKVILFYKPNRG